MSEDAVLSYLKSVDDRTARMEQKIDNGFENLDGRVKSLENSRTAARAGLTVLTLGTTGGAAKMGLLDKIMTIFGGGA